jgi:hypothetical protein
MAYQEKTIGLLIGESLLFFAGFLPARDDRPAHSINALHPVLDRDIGRPAG